MGQPNRQNMLLDRVWLVGAMSKLLSRVLYELRLMGLRFRLALASLWLRLALVHTLLRGQRRQEFFGANLRILVEVNKHIWSSSHSRQRKKQPPRPLAIHTQTTVHWSVPRCNFSSTSLLPACYSRSIL
jgi:hypothetical protein